MLVRARRRAPGVWYDKDMSAEPRLHRFRDMTGATPDDFERDKEESRRWADSPEGREAYRRALEGLREFRRSFLEKTHGRGIPDEWIQEALDEGDDH